MASGKPDKDIFSEIRWPLRLTQWGMVAERVVRSFWPLWSVIFVALALLMLGVQDSVAVEWVWGVGAVLGLAAIWALARGVRQFHWPSREGALSRLDGTLRGNPIQATMDRQAVGASDAASLAVWKAHQDRMRAKLREAHAVEPDLRVAQADPFALRYVALVMLSVAILFGSLMRVQSVTGMGAGGPDLTQGPSWEGWMAPPGYTRMPSVYLNDITAASLDVPEGAQITLRMYGEVGALKVDETISNRPLPEDGVQDTAQDFEVVRSGQLAIDGPGGRVWEIAMIPDKAPTVTRDGDVEVSYEGQAQIPFTATDDHGIEGGVAVFTLALDEVDRRYGRTIEPEARAALEVPLPMPVSGSRAEFTQSLVENFSLHPWANLPVKLEMRVTDARGQTGLSQPEVLNLPGRRFFDPVAAAVIEQRQALLWNRKNAGETSQILRAISNKPGGLFRKEILYLRLRTLLQRIEAVSAFGMSDEQQAEIAQAMWDLALELEEGDLDDARERLKRAQDRLAEAMKNGASDQEIAELMQELRDATADYMRQLAQEQRRQAEQNPDMQQMDPNNTIEMSQDDIQRMMDRIQELMEEGRMDEAMEAMRQLQQMLENMQITQGQGQGGQSPGEQAMEGLSETLRDQQELSDEAFRDLQDQFNRGEGQEGQQDGQQPGQQGQQQPGQQPGQGEGDQPGQQPGQGQGQGQQQGQNGQSLEQSLADRQRALRDELNRQRRNLPGQGTEGGDRAAESLGRAEDAMDGAEEALRGGDLAEAIDQQSEAMEALREGLRNLGEALAQQQQQNQGQQGFAEGGDPQEQRDPLGRNPGNNGQVGSEEGMLQGEDVYRRAQELLDELRQRSGDAERPQAELDYLKRLLDRF
ncbi:TIGR02302 family protein [Primorskyibacter sp. 2E233]|uniref:TIGR02302 family protein n=1 Tax=Primorskyibacter sp. 2E233 TaxID=3413431 RepID=UPI003BF2B087